MQRAAICGCDHTAYEDGGPTKWMPHWTQRISAAIITGDARRCLERLNGLKGEAARTAARRTRTHHHRRRRRRRVSPKRATVRERERVSERESARESAREIEY